MTLGVDKTVAECSIRRNKGFAVHRIANGARRIKQRNCFILRAPIVLGIPNRVSGYLWARRIGNSSHSRS